MWTLYHRLIAGVPEGILITDVVIGEHWVCVICDNGRIGLAMRIIEDLAPSLPASFQGLSLRQAAKELMSWDYEKASVGMAAMNAWYNTQEHLEMQKQMVSDNLSNKQSQDAFIAWQPRVRGKKVAVIGHFPYLETRFAPICDLKILERKPQPGDYPDPACEYILHDQDFVFMTGITLINKTAPRLLQLSRNAQTIIVGPSAPMTTILFDFGVNAIAGFLPEDVTGCLSACQRGDPLFEYGRMAQLFPSNNG